MRIHHQSRDTVEARHPEWDLSQDVFVREKPFLTGLAVGSGINEAPRDALPTRAQLRAAKDEERRGREAQYQDLIGQPMSVGMRVAGVALFLWTVVKWSVISTVVCTIAITAYNLFR